MGPSWHLRPCGLINGTFRAATAVSGGLSVVTLRLSSYAIDATAVTFIAQ
jgi:hypothetical protein